MTLLIANTAYSQIKVNESGNAEYKLSLNNVECISDIERESIKQMLEKNRVDLEAKGVLKNANARQSQVHPLFIWPVTKNPTAPYNNVWSISNHVDHNLSYPNLVQDYNCGDRTYDTNDGYNHKGIDIFLWPFKWYQFQNDQAFAVAAADGIITAKQDGNFDMNCSLNGTNWNAVYIQHSDGSVAWYGHLKNGSLTSKLVGESVVAGEYLGVIGSSGNSTGPHLHFEVYNSSNELVDTYTGNCNTWTSSTDSWWQNQKPYQDPKINALLTHSDYPDFSTCPNTEIVNLSDNFSTGSDVIVEVYLADQVPGTSGTLKIFQPNGSEVYSTNTDITVFYQSSYWYWNISNVSFSINGTWTVTYTYNGETVSHQFEYGTLTNSRELTQQAFYTLTNVSNNTLDIQLKKDHLKVNSVSIYDLYGKRVYAQNEFSKSIDISNLSTSIYIIEINTNEGTFKNKFAKN